MLPGSCRSIATKLTTAHATATTAPAAARSMPQRSRSGRRDRVRTHDTANVAVAVTNVP